MNRRGKPQVLGELCSIEYFQTILIIEPRAEATRVWSPPVGGDTEQVVFLRLPSDSGAEGKLQQGAAVVSIARAKERHVAIVYPEGGGEIHAPAIRCGGVVDFIYVPECQVDVVEVEAIFGARPTDLKELVELRFVEDPLDPFPRLRRIGVEPAHSTSEVDLVS